MASVTTPMALTKIQQEGVMKYFTHVTDTFRANWNFRAGLEVRDRAYMRETDASAEHNRAVVANRTSGDIKRLQNMVVPVVMPQVESNVAYLSGVFCSDFPIFRTISNRENQPAADQINALIAENSVKNAWVRELIMFFRDGLKYNFQAIEVQWEKKTIYSVATDYTGTASTSKTQEVYCEGNRLTRLDPYNTFFDMRVAPADIHRDGEFAGYHKLVNMVTLKRRMLALQKTNATMNFKEALESRCADNIQGSNDSLYYTPQLNTLYSGSQSNMVGTNWAAYVSDQQQRQGGINYADSYIYSICHARIIPSLLGFTGANSNHPQIWTFHVINGKHVIYAERQTNAHDYLPVIFGQPNEDGLGFQTKSVLDNALPFQEMSSALWNSAIAAKRRLVYDRLIYNPLLVRKEDIDNTSEVARIPMRNASYSRNPHDAVYQFPFRDDNTASTLAMSQQIVQMGDIASGQNRVQQGQFQKGNKTQDEFNSVMGNANLRQQMQALAIEYQVLQPIKEILKLNILQYQPDGKTVYDRGNKQAVTIDMAALRKADLAFTISDGLLTVDKLMSPQLMQVFLQTAQAMPAMQSEYDVLGLFIYWLKVQGATWVDDFYRDPKQQAQALQQIKAAGVASGAVDQPVPPQGAPSA